MSVELQRISTTQSNPVSKAFVFDDHRPPSPAPSEHSDDGAIVPTTDIESGTTKPLPADPYLFRSAVKSDNELQALRKRGNKGKLVEEYHNKQNELIENLLKPMEEHTEDAKEADGLSRLPVRIAVLASLIANFCLCVIQLYATISSGSLSILATGIDSIFDFGSNLVLLYLHKKAANLELNKWPVGGSRLETIGNILYGSLMASVNLVVIVESIRTLTSHKSGELNGLHIPSLVAVAAALVVKFCLFLYCLSLRKSSSQVAVLWEDHRNDLWINSFGILMSAGGSKLRWWLDPTGGLIIALGVIAAWSRTVWEQFELLAGKSAPHEFIQLLVYKAVTFSDEIEKVDTVRAYHSGPDYFVEIDVVMSGDTPLWKAHDVAQALQDKIEVLPGVDRAFVHVDHETTHAPEHRKNV